MRIAVEGCAHGELDAIYEEISRLDARDRKSTDILLVCGDFQAIRNELDLGCMAVPDKYKSLGGFWRYYSGLKEAPLLTIVIGGNHEASNYMWELYHGGFLAPNIYFLGHAGSVYVNRRLRVTGLSGIWKSSDWKLGHHETVPYTPSTMRSIYHIREYCVQRLSLLPPKNPSVFLSHDWPQSIEHYGDVQSLLRRKPFFREDIDSGQLGSPPQLPLLQRLKPNWWFSAHLHTRFEACVRHDQVAVSTSTGYGKVTAEDSARGEDPNEIVIEDVDDLEDHTLQSNTRQDFQSPSQVTEHSITSDISSANRSPNAATNPDEIHMSDEEFDVVVSAPAPPPPINVERPVGKAGAIWADNEALMTGTATNFLALDKCVRGRKYLEVMDISLNDEAQDLSATVELSFDPHHLAISRALHPWLSLGRMQKPLPTDQDASRLIAEAEDWLTQKFGSSVSVPDDQSEASSPKIEDIYIPVDDVQKFVMTAPPQDPSTTSNQRGRGGRGGRSGRGKGGPSHGVSNQPPYYTNPQTVAFCELIGVDNLINKPPEGFVPPTTSDKS